MRALGCFIVILLANDTINPVKILSEMMGTSTLWATILSFVIFVTIVWGNFYELAYFSIVVFLKSILSIFYSSVEVLGKQNIPLHGPVIFTGNHMNQFVDGAIVFATNPHRVRFMVAKKSYDTNIVGFFAKATGSIPVARPQDSAIKGIGEVQIIGNQAIGQGTNFLSLSAGDKMRIGSNNFGIKKIESDTVIELGLSDNGADPTQQTQREFNRYDILPRVDQTDFFEQVHKSLALGQCLGIFPEGGSHDRTDLLPLKAGIAAIAYGTLEKYNVNVPIVPVGLTYFRADKYRGRAVVEFGEPIRISPEMADKYKEDKRGSYTELLSKVEDGMRKVIVTAPDYQVLKLIHTARRLYRKPAQSVRIAVRQDLSRRFAIGYMIIRKRYTPFPTEIQELYDALEEYQKKLDYWGLKDYQITNLDVPFNKMLYNFLHALVLAVLASIPSLLLNLPVGMAAKSWAEHNAKKDLARSKVKISARDVIMSRKIIFSLGAVPVLWVVYFFVLFFFSIFSLVQIILILLLLPLFSYIGVMAVEAGMMDIKELRPLFLRLFPSYRHEASNFPTIRNDLMRRVRAMVRKYGPELGALYYDKDVDLDKYMDELKMVGIKEDVGIKENGDEDENNAKDNIDSDPSLSPQVRLRRGLNGHASSTSFSTIVDPKEGKYFPENDGDDDKKKKLR